MRTGRTPSDRLGLNQYVLALERLGCKVEACSLELPDILTSEGWADIGSVLGEIERAAGSVNWLIGDWWNDGQHRHGALRRVVDGDDWIGPSYQTWANAASACRAFESSRRRENLTFSHHAEVASLAPNQADELLDWCEEIILQSGKPRSIRELRAERDRRIRMTPAQTSLQARQRN